MPTQMLRVEDLRVAYMGMPVLNEVSMHIDAGEMVALLGRNGAGKSTTMRAIAGLVPADGRIEFGGRSIKGMAPHQIVKLGVGFVQEGKRVFTSLSVADNLTLGAFTRRGQKELLRQSLERVFELFPVLETKYRQQAGTLSGGEQQMLSIAQALMASPKLLMVDEPSQGLAPALVDDVLRALRSLRDTGTALLVAEQFVDKILPMSDRVYVLNLGRIAITGTPVEVAGSSALRDVYIGGEVVPG